MLDVLREIESALPMLLADESAWTGVFADSEKPHLRRLWRQCGEYRVYLHLFTGCMPTEIFPHPHPWKFAVRILEGRYQMGVGTGTGPDTPPPEAAVMEFAPGSCYEMTLREGWHWIRPLDGHNLTIMVAGPVIWEENRRVANHICRALTPEERAELFDAILRHYPRR